jgi:hypothetical protein
LAERNKLKKSREEPINLESSSNALAGKALSEVLKRSQCRVMRRRPFRTIAEIRITEVSTRYFAKTLMISDASKGALDWVLLLELIAACEREGLKCGDLTPSQVHFVGRCIQSGKNNLEKEWPSIYVAEGQLVCSPAEGKFMAFYTIPVNERRLKEKIDGLFRERGCIKGIPSLQSLVGIIGPFAAKLTHRKEACLYAAVQRCYMRTGNVKKYDIAYDADIAPSTLSRWLKARSLQRLLKQAILQVAKSTLSPKELKDRNEALEIRDSWDVSEAFDRPEFSTDKMMERQKWEARNRGCDFSDDS